MTDAVTERIRGAKRVCLFAHYHPHGIVAPHVLIYLAALRAEGFAIVVMSTATLDAGEQAKLAAACECLVMRANHGLDFGGWIEAFQRFAPLSAELLLLANDSVYAPVGDLHGFIDGLLAHDADFYGAVESAEGGVHLQSWFLLLRPRAYRAPVFQDLMLTPIPPEMSKTEIIERYEMGLTQALAAAGLTYHAAYTPTRRGPVAQRRVFNPMHLLWRRLVERDGIPFIKVELLRDNPVLLRGLDDWRAVVEPRNAPLAAAMADDVARRRRYTPPTWREQLRGEIYLTNSVYWPELHRIVEADHDAGAARGGLVWAVYRAGEKVAGTLRRIVKPFVKAPWDLKRP